MSAAASMMPSADETVSAVFPAAADTTVVIAIAQTPLRGRVAEALRRISIPVTEEHCGMESVDELVSNLERIRPGILLLGLEGLPTDPALLLARISKLDGAPRVVIVNDRAEPEIILKAMRAGAAEFVYPPFEAAAFEEAMRRTIADAGRVVAQARCTGSVIGFVSAKGGCGATTLACHASSHLRSSTKKEVLLADLDQASGITGSIMQTVARYSLDDALRNLHRMDLKLWKALVSTSPCGVDVVPAVRDTTVSGATLTRKMPPMLRFWRMQYDFTILDLGHGITQSLLDVIDSLDKLVLVSTNEVPALRQAKQLIHILAARSFGVNRLKLVINRMPGRPQIQLPELEKVMGHPIFATVVNDYERLSEAYSEPRLVDPNSDIGAQMGRFADKLTGLTSAGKPRTLFGLWRKK